MAQLLVLHGPNLNLLGTREPEVYGRTTLADIDADLAARAQAAGHRLASLQSNAEHELVDRVQVTVFPVISGQTGTRPVFEDAADFDLELIESRTLDGHTQELIYRPTRHG